MTVHEDCISPDTLVLAVRYVSAFAHNDALAAVVQLLHESTVSESKKRVLVTRMGAMKKTPPISFTELRDIILKERSK